MKITDDYAAKYRLWAQAPEVRPMPRPVSLPAFQSRKFDSWEAFNAWKRQYLLEVAREGGIKWTS